MHAQRCCARPPTHAGYGPELARAVCRYAGVECQLVPFEYLADRIPALANGTVDALFAVSGCLALWRIWRIQNMMQKLGCRASSRPLPLLRSVRHSVRRPLCTRSRWPGRARPAPVAPLVPCPQSLAVTREREKLLDYLRPFYDAYDISLVALENNAAALQAGGAWDAVSGKNVCAEVR